MRKESITVNYVCSVCGSYLDSMFRCPNNCHDSQYLPYYSRTYNYKCPQCNGEFNQPAYQTTTSTTLMYRCPWCGRELGG